MMTFNDYPTLVLLLQSNNYRISQEIAKLPLDYKVGLLTPEIRKALNLENAWVPTVQKVLDVYQSELSKLSFENQISSMNHILQGTPVEGKETPARALLRQIGRNYPYQRMIAGVGADQAQIASERTHNSEIHLRNLELRDSLLQTHSVLQLIPGESSNNPNFIKVKRSFSIKVDTMLRGLANGINFAPYFEPTMDNPVFRDLHNWVAFQTVAEKL